MAEEKLSNRIERTVFRHYVFELDHRRLKPVIGRIIPVGVGIYLRKRHLQRAQRFPTLFSIETTSACNAKCWSRPQATNTQTKGIMTFETFKKVTDQIVPYRDEVRSIALFIDGEPTLNKQLINFLKYVDELRLNKLFLSSNMEFFTRELTDKIFAADIGHTLQYVNCSLDGFNE